MPSRKNAPQPAVVPSVQSASGPQLTTETKFMQQYRIAAAAHGGGDIVAIRNRQGNVEAFTVGTDSTVWNFYPDAASDTGYSSVSTGLVAKSVTAGTDALGRIVLFASNNLVLNYVRETNQPGARWGTVQTATLPQPISPIAIAGIYASQIGGALHVGVLTRFKSASPGNTYALSYCVWDDQPGIFLGTTVTLSTLNCIWTGSNAATAAFSVVDGVYLAFNIATMTTTRFPFAGTFKTTSVATSLDSASNNQIFAVLADGNLYRMIGGSGGKAFSWAQITQSMSFREVQTALAGDNNIQIFTLDSGSRLFHFEPSNQTSTGWTDPMVIEESVALLGLAQQNGGNIELFTVGTTQATVHHLIRQEASGNWQITALEVATSGQVEEYISYSTDIMVYDAVGAPMPNAPIQVWASSQTQIEVNGASFTVDAQTPANLTCAASGALTITQPTGILGIPSLQFNVVSAMPPGQSIVVEQFAGVQDRLATVTGPDLMTAKTADGSYLLQDTYRTPAQTDSLATAFNECMKLTETTAVPRLGPAALSAKRRRKGVHRTVSDRTAELNRLAYAGENVCWQLDFSSGGPVFRRLSVEDASNLLHEKRATHGDRSMGVGGFLDWIGSIADFVEGVAQGIISVVDTVITAIGSAVNAAITFVVNGVTYLFETVVHLIEQAFDLVEVFFAQVKVVFEKIFEWLGFIFSWPDILRTHDALAYTMEQFLGFLPGAAAGIQTLFDSGINSIKSQVNTFFDRLVADVGGTASLGGYTDTETPDSPTYTSGNANNIVLNSTVTNSRAASQSTNVLPPNATAWDVLTQQMEQFASSVENDPSFAAALDYMKNLGGSPDQLFTQLLSALIRVVQGLVNVVLSGVQAIVDGILQLIQLMLATLQELFSAEWNIPFVSQFYSWLTNGSKLTLSDLIALILAIPATIIYKVLYGAAPFPDSASVAAFKASFNSQTMLANSGLGGASAKAEADATAVTTPSAEQASAWKVLLGVSGLCSSWAYGIMSAIMDVKPTTGAGVVDPLIKTMTKFALGAEIYAQAAGFPWLYSSGAPNCSSSDGAGKWVWLYTCLGVAIDSGFTIYDSAFPENNDTIWGVVVATIYGVGHVVVTAVSGSQLSGAALASNIIVCIPEVGKLLKLPAIETATEGVSLIVIAAADGLCIVASSICAFVDLISSGDAALAQLPVPGAVPALPAPTA